MCNNMIITISTMTMIIENLTIIRIFDAIAAYVTTYML